MRHAIENIGTLRNTHTCKTTSIWNRQNHTVPSVMMSIDESRHPPTAPLRLSPLPPPQQSYRAIQEAGLPVNPLEFPTPVIHRAYLRTQQSIYDQKDNVTLLCPVNRSEYAYWIKHAVPSIGPNIHMCVIVTRRCINGSEDNDHAQGHHHYHHRSNDHVNNNDWITTEKWVWMKSTSLHHSRPCSSTTEPACLQLIGNYHNNILGCSEVLQSDDYVYTVMSYYPGSYTLESYLQQQQQQQQQRPPLASAPQWNTIRPPTYATGSNTNIAMIRERYSPKRIDPTSMDVPPSDNTITTVSSDGTTLTNDDNTSVGGSLSTGTMFTVYENSDQKICTNSNHCTLKAISPHESHVRMLFLQLLEALQHLQRKGVCHRNITPSTVLIVEINPVSAGSSNSSCGSHLVVLTDFSHAVRIPYRDDSNVGGIADVSQGSNRFLIKNTDGHRARTARSPSHNTNRTVVTTNSQSPRVRRYQSASLSPTNRYNHPTSRKVASSTLPMPNRKSLKSAQPQRRQQRSPFVAPELIEGQPYDGYTVDLWSVGVLLYVMLMGAVPFHVPNMTTDVQYRQIQLGQLNQIIRQQRTLNDVSQQQQNYFLSDEVIDLLQNMFWYDPRKRLTLQAVMAHPWVRSNCTVSQQQQF